MTFDKNWNFLSGQYKTMYSQSNPPPKWHRLHKNEREVFTKKWTKEWIKIAILNEIWNGTYSSTKKGESSESRLALFRKSFRR